MLKIVACVEGTRRLGLTYGRGSGGGFSVYADSSFASKMEVMIYWKSGREVQSHMVVQLYFGCSGHRNV